MKNRIKINKATVNRTRTVKKNEEKPIKVKERDEKMSLYK